MLKDKELCFNNSARRFYLKSIRMYAYKKLFFINNLSCS